MNKLERIIVTKTPAGYLLQKSKKWYLPGFEGVPLFDVIVFFYRQVKTTGLTERASAIAYNFIMAVPPSLLFLFTLVPSLPFISKKSLKIQLHGLIIDVIPLKIHNENLIKFVDSFIDSSKIGIISIGFITALYFASNAMMGIMRSFNKNYVGFAKRQGLHNRWMAIKLTAFLFLVILGSLILLITQGAVLKLVGIKSVTILNIIYYVRWVFIVGIIFYSQALIYKYAPAVHKRWKLVSPGTILATTLSIFASVGFSYFVNNFGKYNALYGSIGTIMVLMVMVYLNSLVLLVGFELNVSIKTIKANADSRQVEEKNKKK